MERKKKILIIGAGSIGERHARCFLATERAHVSVCEINNEVREKSVRQYRIERAYAEFQEAIVDSHDGAVIATPAHLHIPMAIRLAEQGVYPLIEKPLSTSLDGMSSLETALAQGRLQAAVAYVLRHGPALRAMRDAIHAGQFGKPVQLVAVCGQHFPTFRPAYRQIYYARRATGGGAIQDAMTHIINAGEWVLGPIDRLVADAAHQVLEGVDVEDTVHVIARHGDRLASYSLNQHQAPEEVVFTVACRQGTCRCWPLQHRWAWMTEPKTEWQEQTFDMHERDELFIAQAHAFLDLVEGKAQPTCTLQEGLQTLRVNLAMLASVQDGSWKRTVSE